MRFALPPVGPPPSVLSSCKIHVIGFRRPIESQTEATGIPAMLETSERRRRDRNVYGMRCHAAVVIENLNLPRDKHRA